MASRKGSPNKVGAEAKENIVAVFTRLGSTAAMAKWAEDNKTEFYKLYARLIPAAVEGTVEVEHKAIPDESTLAAKLAAVLASRQEPESPTVQ